MAEWANSLGLWWYIIFYFVMQLVNVVLNTLKTIITAKATKIPAAIINALTFGFYTLVIYLTAGAGNIWVNMAITVIANLIGVYFSIMVLDKLKKDKLWEVVATTNETDVNNIAYDLTAKAISYNMFQAHGKKHNDWVFHIYCPTQKQSAIVKTILQKYETKYIVHEENVQL